MKRRVVFEIMAVVAISLALGGGAIRASRDGGGQKETTTAVFGFPAPTDWPTPDPNNMQPIPGRHFVGAHQCNVPRAAREVSVPQATSKGGRVLDDGLDRYYLTASGRCITIADDTRETRNWIPMELEARLEDPNDIIWPCQIPY